MDFNVTIRVCGHLSAEWGAVLGGMDVACQPDGNATLTGSVPDQAALYGLLLRLRDLGLALVSVNMAPEPGASGSHSVAPGPNMPSATNAREGNDEG